MWSTTSLFEIGIENWVHNDAWALVEPKNDSFAWVRGRPHVRLCHLSAMCKSKSKTQIPHRKVWPMTGQANDSCTPARSLIRNEQYKKKTHQFACHVMPETRIQNKARNHATQQIHATENSLPNHLPSSKVIYSLILGMCLTKKNGYPIYSSRRQQIRLQQNCIFFLRALLSSRLLLLCFSHFEPSRVCDWGVFSVSVLPLLLLVY